jgi:hypothetical protein
MRLIVRTEVDLFFDRDRGQPLSEHRQGPTAGFELTLEEKNDER